MIKLRRRLIAKYQGIKKRLLEKPAVQFLARVMSEMSNDDASDLAASISYWALLSLFPLLVGIVALLGIFLPSESVQTRIFDFFQSQVPGVTNLVEQNVKNIIRLRGTLGGIGIAGLFWTGSGVFTTIDRVVNRAWDIRQLRPLYVRKPIELGLALGSSILFFLSLAATAFASIIPSLNLPAVGSLVIWGSRLFSFLLVWAMLLIIYKLMPNTTVYWRDIWLGALLAAVLFEVAKDLFVFYLSRFANYQMIYGSLASVVILLVWIYYSAFIFVFGAEFSSEYGRRKKRA